MTATGSAIVRVIEQLSDEELQQRVAETTTRLLQDSADLQRLYEEMSRRSL